MKLIDVTLRDGGFVNDFNWDISFAKNHYKKVSDMKLHYCELGYWKQSAKSSNRFYSLNEDDVIEIVDGVDGADIAVMIDYHYCSKNFNDYPKALTNPVKLIRLTARREDINEAAKFAAELKDATNLKVAFQIINSTNYSRDELIKTVNGIKDMPLSMIYFADSHGNMDLLQNWNIFEPSVEILKNAGIKVGFHLHNHTNRGLTNYMICKSNNIEYMDASIRGLGKGIGNLRLEDIIHNEVFPDMLEYMSNSTVKEMKISKKEAFYKMTGRLNITDNYANVGIDLGLDFKNFWNSAKLLDGVDKDTYDKNKLIQIIESV